MTNQTIDPELVDDREVQEVPLVEVEIPDYDPNQFELSDDYEYTDEDGDDDGDEDEE